MMLRLPGGSVSTCGRVMKAPPSMGQHTICGSWPMVVRPYCTGTRPRTRRGNALRAVKGARR